MAKKNSSKTATEKAISSSEPRVISFRGWQGVNFVDAPLTWDPLQSGPTAHRQTNLPQNFLMVQNNLDTTETLAVETRRDSENIGDVPAGCRFTGVATVYKHWIFAVVDDGTTETVRFRDLLSDDTSSWTKLGVQVGGADAVGCKIEEIGFFEENLVATATVPNGSSRDGVLLLARVTTDSDDKQLAIKGMDWSATPPSETKTNYIVDTPKVCPETDKPSMKPKLFGAGGMVVWRPEDHPDEEGPPDTTPCRVQVKFCYTNRLGSTLPQDDRDCAVIYTELSPALWTTKKYLTVRPNQTSSGTWADEDVPEYEAETGAHASVSGIDFYARDDENLDWVFAGHIEVTPNQLDGGTAKHSWFYNWYGNMTDITQWLTAQLMVPTENTTHGPGASHFSCHDSRMYFWGVPGKPYRLLIGGNPGAEFSVARGLGGAWVDIEPGSGYDIKGTAKWKTVSGANIVTIMCGNRNTSKVKRFNLVETNLTLSNEVAYKSYMYEEVSNVVGCNSRWGYGVYDEGLYALSRYGLMLTTMAMEYNAQMRNQNISNQISPIFTERLGKRLRDGRMTCIDGIIYIALSEDADPPLEEPVALDNVIICYHIGLKAWYTWTHDEVYGTDSGDPDRILHILPIDSDEHVEGLGAITETQIRLYPTTGIQDALVPEFQVLLETGEMMPKMPMQVFFYVQQLELRFDYFVGDPDDPATVLIEGVDYYGRPFTIEKKLNIKSRGHHGRTGEMRDYVEWIRIDKIAESMRLRIKGKARFRLTHMNMKLYQQADVIGTPYGFDAKDTYRGRHGKEHVIHHYIDDYNNLRRAVVS